jgi:hypothetical protein
MHALHGHRLNPHQEFLMIPVWLDDAKERAHDPRPHGGGPRAPITFPIETVVHVRATPRTRLHHGGVSVRLAHHERPVGVPPGVAGMSRWTNCRWRLTTFNVVCVMDAEDRMANVRVLADTWRLWVAT